MSGRVRPAVSNPCQIGSPLAPSQRFPGVADRFAATGCKILKSMRENDPARGTTEMWFLVHRVVAASPCVAASFYLTRADEVVQDVPGEGRVFGQQICCLSG